MVNKPCVNAVSEVHLGVGRGCAKAICSASNSVCCMILQVLHVHGFSGVGLHCAYLVVACSLMFRCEFDSFKRSVESLPNPAAQLVAGSNGAHTPTQRYGPYRIKLYTHLAQQPSTSLY